MVVTILIRGAFLDLLDIIKKKKKEQ